MAHDLVTFWRAAGRSEWLLILELEGSKLRLRLDCQSVTIPTLLRSRAWSILHPATALPRAAPIVRATSWPLAEGRVLPSLFFWCGRCESPNESRMRSRQ